MAERWLDRNQFAQVMGWRSTATVSRALSQTRRKVANGEPLTARDLPIPDRLVGNRSPVWLEEQVEAFRSAWQVRQQRTTRRPPNRLRLPVSWVRAGDAVLDTDGIRQHVVLTDTVNGKVRLLVRTRSREAGRWLPPLAPDETIDVLRW